MKQKTAEFVNVFDQYWTYVERAERDIRQNGHLGRLPPICHGDPWDEQFAAACDAVHPYLSKFRKERYYAVPAGLAFRSGPIKAITAHQALMFFLNRPDELYGEKGVLDSTEYKTIKEAAIAELKQRDEVRVTRTQPRCSRSALQRSQVIDLRAYLLDYHFPKGLPVRDKPLLQKSIEKHFNWSQGKVSKIMRKLFKGGMDEYVSVFGSDVPPTGYRQRFDDLSVSVDALWIDRHPGDDEDEEE